jgi:hypothetical protein
MAQGWVVLISGHAITPAASAAWTHKAAAGAVLRGSSCSIALLVCTSNRLNKCWCSDPAVFDQCPLFNDLHVDAVCTPRHRPCCCNAPVQCLLRRVLPVCCVPQ